jgi:hypothetical protein
MAIDLPIARSRSLPKLLLGHIRLVIVRIAIDKLVQWVDSRPIRARTNPQKAGPVISLYDDERKIGCNSVRLHNSARPWWIP